MSTFLPRRRALGAFVLSLALALTAAGLTTTGDAHAAAAKVSVSPARPMAGERTVFSGRLPGARRPVLLQRKAGKRWTVVDRARANSKGRFRLAAKVPRTGSYRVHAPRAGGRPAVSSRVRKVRTARQRATVASIDAPLVVGLSRTVTAKVTPARKGRVVALQRRTGSGWTTVAKARSDKQGVALVRYAGTAPGTADHRVLGLRFRGSKSVASPAAALHTARTVSLLSPGTTPGDESTAPSVSSDGRWVVFSSTARLLASDVDDRSDVYLHDRHTGGLAHLLAGANHSVSGPIVSGNGRFVAFNSLASNLVEPDAGNDTDVFVLDRTTGTVHLVSRTPGGQPANDPSDVYGISDDGRFVAFASFASDLVPPLGAPVDTMTRHAYLHDRVSGTNRGLDRVGGGWADSNVYGLDVSGDGTTVVFQSADDALDPGDVDGLAIFGWTIAPNGSISNRTNLTPDVHASRPHLSRNGDLLAFTSSEDVAPADVNGQSDAYVRTAPGSYQLASPVGPDDTEAFDLSPDGRYVALSTESPMVGDTNGNDDDVVIHDRLAGSFRLVTRGGPGASSEPKLSGDGSVVVLGSEAAGLAPGGTVDWNVYAAVLR